MSDIDASGNIAPVQATVTKWVISCKECAEASKAGKTIEGTEVGPKGFICTHFSDILMQSGVKMFFFEMDAIRKY